MESKDVQTINPSVLLDTTPKVSDDKSSKLQPISSLKQRSLSALPSQAVKVDIDSAVQDGEGSRDLRGKANQAIDAINVAAEAASEIEKLVKGIDGIVGQAQELLKSDSKNPQESQSETHRVPLLEQEANQLLGEIKKLARSQAPNGVRPLAGDKIRLDIEEKVGKALEVILPNEASDAFGIDSLSLSSIDAIVNARANVEEARDRIQKIRDSITSTHKEVSSIVGQLEVAFQNSESARASIRDVDEALKVVSETSRKISGNPDGALKAIRIGKGSLTLLEG
jgi:flagellin-like hook-associated protein FlgL